MDAPISEQFVVVITDVLDGVEGICFGKIYTRNMVPVDQWRKSTVRPQVVEPVAVGDELFFTVTYSSQARKVPRYYWSMSRRALPTVVNTT